MFNLCRGEIRLLDESCFSSGQVLKSENAYVASVLQNGAVIGNSKGKTELVIEENGNIVQRICCMVTDSEKALPLLLNRYNKIEKPAGFLITLPRELSREGSAISLELNTAKAFVAMAKAAKEQGICLFATQGYRSYENQLKIIELYIKREGKEKAMRRCAPAGFSEHHSGLAIDVSGGIFENGIYKSDPQAVLIWIEENCFKYGFMIKNLPKKEHITGTLYEPWHIRYLGDIVLCSYLHDNKLSLDEYLDKLRADMAKKPVS